MERPGLAISPWESMPNPSTPGGCGYEGTESPLKKKSNGREAVSPFTSATQPVIRWSWSRLACGDCKAVGELCRISSARPAGLNTARATKKDANRRPSTTQEEGTHDA